MSRAVTAGPPHLQGRGILGYAGLPGLVDYLAGPLRGHGTGRMREPPRHLALPGQQALA